MNRPTISQALRADRLRMGLSEAELARRLGVTQQSVSKWEHGTPPRPARLRRMIEVLGRDGQLASLVTTTRGEPMGNFEQLPDRPPIDPAHALAALARAADDLARAAQAIAEAVERTTRDPRKH